MTATRPGAPAFAALGRERRKEIEMDRIELLTMDKTDAIAALADEANWPAMNAITRALWQHLTPEQRYVWMAAPRQECSEPRADGRCEHPSSIPRYYRRGRR